MLGAGEGRAWPAESLGEQRKPASILKAISCFVSRAPVSPTLPLVRVGTGSTGQTRGTQEDRPGSPQPSVHLPASPSLGTENYLCLQIAFDSHELFLLPANRSGDGRGLSSRRAEKSDGGRGAEAEVTSLRIWSQLCHRRAVPSPPLPSPGPGLLICRRRGLGGLRTLPSPAPVTPKEARMSVAPAPWPLTT